MKPHEVQSGVMSRVLAWRWGPGRRLGFGALIGIILVVVCLLAIVWDLTLNDDQPHGPALLHDFVPEQQLVCSGVNPAEVTSTNDAWKDHGWPAWPPPVPRATDCPRTAPPGTVVWHTCNDLRVGDDGTLMPPCTPEEGDGVARPGATYARVGAGEIIAVDVYLHTTRHDCTATHEAGHARGLVSKDGQSAHASTDGTIMSPTCGPSWRFLDRREGGDWDPSPAEPL